MKSACMIGSHGMMASSKSKQNMHQHTPSCKHQ